MKLFLAPFLLLPLAAHAALDINGVVLGSKEADLKRAFPSAHCKKLEWQSPAADRRCDDSRASFGGVPVRVIFYLKKGAVEAFDVRFETRELDRFAAFLKARYGAPTSESRERAERRDKSARETYKVLWEDKRDRAVLLAPLEKRSASLLVSRGDFEEEIYRIP